MWSVGIIIQKRNYKSEGSDIKIENETTKWMLNDNMTLQLLLSISDLNDLPCLQTFAQIYDENVGLSSGCDVIGGKDSLTYFDCIQLACDKGANTIDYANNICHLRNCEDDDIKLSDKNGGWNILRKRGKCMKYSLSSLMKGYIYIYIYI